MQMFANKFSWTLRGLLTESCPRWKLQSHKDLYCRKTLTVDVGVKTAVESSHILLVWEPMKKSLFQSLVIFQFISVFYEWILSQKLLIDQYRNSTTHF